MSFCLQVICDKFCRPLPELLWEPLYTLLSSQEDVLDFLGRGQKGSV